MQSLTFLFFHSISKYHLEAFTSKVYQPGVFSLQQCNTVNIGFNALVDLTVAISSAAVLRDRHCSCFVKVVLNGFVMLATLQHLVITVVKD